MDLYTASLNKNPFDAAVWSNRAAVRLKLEEYGLAIADASESHYHARSCDGSTLKWVGFYSESDRIGRFFRKGLLPSGVSQFSHLEAQGGDNGSQEGIATRQEQCTRKNTTRRDTETLEAVTV